MTYPEHWPKPDRDCACGDCDWTGQESAIDVSVFEASDLHERLDPGHPLPAGECPECGSWAYVVTPYSQCQDAALGLLAALERIMAEWDASDGRVVTCLTTDDARAAIAKARGK